MTVHDTARAPIVPTQRTTATDQAPHAELASAEPGRRSRGARPRSEYWDVETASWRSRGPVPPQRYRV